jgi:hypothetical protein
MRRGHSRRRVVGEPGYYRYKGDGPGTLRLRLGSTGRETVLGHDAVTGLWLDTLADPAQEARVRAARVEVYARQTEAGMPLDYHAGALAALALLGEGE